MDLLSNILSSRAEELEARSSGPGRARVVYRLIREGRDPSASGAQGSKARPRLASVYRPNQLEITELRTAPAGGTRKLLVPTRGRASSRGGVLIPLALLLFLALVPARSAHAQFVHPGGLHTQDDFDRMAAKVAAGESPWIDTYRKLIVDPHAQLNWTARPVRTIIRGGTGQNYTRSQEDAQAIYDLALRYRVSGDTAYADKAVSIMDAWSSTLTGVGGDSNYALASGICGYLFAIAGEALHGYSGWSDASQAAYANMLVNAIYSANHGFLTRHNGTCGGHYRCNWDTSNMASMIAIGVFADRQDIFDEAVTYFKSGIGNGNINRAVWFIHADGLGQTEESGRDQPHNFDGFDSLGMMAEIAWNQGVDLYGYDNNRLLRGLEYIAKYNLGNDVSYVPYLSCDIATERTISARAGGFSPQGWERAYNHYVNRMGLAAPNLAQVAARLRPDGPPNNYGSHPSRFDWLGLQSLTFALDPIPSGGVPTGLTAKVSGHKVNLTWWGTAYATGYNVKRSTTSGGPYSTIAAGIAATSYIDLDVVDGTTYYYVVSALSPGESADSDEAFADFFAWLSTYLPFDETNGSIASDVSGGGWDGTLVNGPAWAPGYIGNAVHLNGTNQYVSLPAGVIADLDEFTIAAWVNLDNATAWTRIFDFGLGTERYMFLTPQAGNGGPMRFTITKTGGRGEQQITAPAPLQALAWHHVAVTLSDGTGILYLDGVEVGRSDSMFLTPSMIGDTGRTTQNWIGRSQFSNDPYLGGLVDELRIYHGALSADDIAALASGSAGSNTCSQGQ